MPQEQFVPKSVLVIEDDPHIVDILRMNLEEAGLSLDHAGDGVTGLNKALGNPYALIILDLMLPQLGGLDVCKKIREQNKQIPLLIVTSRSEEIDVLLGLELGADDYIKKPFSIRELTARVRALLRRADTKPVAGGATAEPDAQIVCKDLVINVDKRTVTRGGTAIVLTAMEFELLTFLASHPGYPFTKEQLTESVWGYHSSGHDATIYAQLSKLRKKIEPDPDNPVFIMTVWGVGYKFAECG